MNEDGVEPMELPPDASLDGAIVRPYRSSDRESVRRICVETADGGYPLDLQFFPDAELFADLLTSYYTDYEPQSVLVADAGGEVVGYLTGCHDTLAMQRTLWRRIVFHSLWRALRRGTLLSVATWRTLWSNALVWTSSVIQRQRHLGRYPAQLHVNLRPGGRGRSLGRALVDRFVAGLATQGVPGVEASVREDNVRARRFFEGLGFVALGRTPLLVRRGRTLSSVVYGKRLP